MASDQLSVFSARGLSMQMFIDVPERPKDVATRHHNRFCKNAMRDVLQYHHDHHIPLHYKGASSAQRYNYAPRSPKYNAIKRRQFHHDYPLVRTGATSKKHKQPQGYKSLRVGGAAEGGKRGLVGILEYLLAFSEAIREHFKAKHAAAKGKSPSEAKRIRNEQRKSRRQMLLADARRRGVTIGQMRKEIEQMTRDEVAKLAEVFLQSYVRQYNEFKSKRKRVRLPTK